MSSRETWSAVDAFVTDRLVGEDDALAAAARESEAQGLPPIQVSPPLGKLLALIVRIQGARSVLEIGTLGGYSTIWLARALPADGDLVTLELEQAYADVAARNLERAGVAGKIRQIVGPAIESLRELREQGAGPFDLVFIDADKRSTPEYFELALELTRAGSLIVTDNVVRGGAVADADSDDEGAQGMRRFHEQLARTPGVTATTIQTVGVKGYDGFTLALVENE